MTFGLLHEWLTDLGMTISANTLRNWLKKGKKYLDQLIVVLKSIALEKDSVNKSEKIVIFFYEDGSRGRDVLTNFLGDAELKSIMTDGYNAYVFIGDELKSTQFKDTEHQICLAHAMAKFAKAANPGGDERALIFYDDLALFPVLERRYDKDKLAPGERGQARQSLETKEIIMRLRMNLTTQHNNMLHFGSDEGVEMAAAYHSVISTVKLHGMSSWRYLGDFFQKVFNGCLDFFSMPPLNIRLAHSKC